LAEIVHKMFLFLEYKGKVSLSPHHPLTIGRTPVNGIVITSLTVSRQHAAISYKDGAYIIQDLNSRNGTFLNGKRVQRAKLHNGDSINIGGYQIGVHTADENEMDEDDTLKDLENVFATTIDIRREAFGLMVGNVTGDLSSISIDEIVQIIEINSKTGVLQLYKGPERLLHGKLYFGDGEIIHAIFEGRTGMNAAIKLLQTTRGGFEFLSDKASPDRTVTKSTMWLLYEAHRLRDEENRIPK